MANKISLRRILKDKFDYDVSGLPAWNDNTMPNMIPDLIANSEFLKDLTLETGVKGTLEIALLSADIELQAKVGCTPSPDGSVIFTKRDLTTVLLYAGIEFCNETLNRKMTQVLNRIGLKMQNGQLPGELEDILVVYLNRLIARKAQRLVLLGDTTSLVPELALMDGLIKRIKNDPDVIEYQTPNAALNSLNAYNVFFNLYKRISTELLDNGMPVKIYTGRAEALLVIEAWNNANPYSQIDVPEGGTHIEFVLPRTGTRIKTLPELNNTGEAIAMPLDLYFLGVDEEEDMNVEIKYDDYNDKLKAEASFRLGTNFVWGEYTTRLTYTPS